jgi:hypothetical protein
MFQLLLVFGSSVKDGLLKLGVFVLNDSILLLLHHLPQLDLKSTHQELLLLFLRHIFSMGVHHHLFFNLILLDLRLKQLAGFFKLSFFTFIFFLIDLLEVLNLFQLLMMLGLSLNVLLNV